MSDEIEKPAADEVRVSIPGALWWAIAVLTKWWRSGRAGSIEVHFSGKPGAKPKVLAKFEETEDR